MHPFILHHRFWWNKQWPCNGVCHLLTKVFFVNKPKMNRRKQYCGIKYCQNSYGVAIGMIRIPSDSKHRKQWLDAIATYQPTNTITTGFRICELHFKATDIKLNSRGYYTCKPGCFPQFFPTEPTINTFEAVADEYAQVDDEAIAYETHDHTSVAINNGPECSGDERYNMIKIENAMLKEKNYRLTKKLQDKKKKIKQLADKVYYEKSCKVQLKELAKTLKEKKYITDEGAASFQMCNYCKAKGAHVGCCYDVGTDTVLKFWRKEDHVDCGLDAGASFNASKNRGTVSLCFDHRNRFEGADEQNESVDDDSRNGEEYDIDLHENKATVAVVLEQSAVSDHVNSVVTQDPLGGKDVEYLEELASAAVKQEVAEVEPNDEDDTRITG